MKPLHKAFIASGIGYLAIVSLAGLLGLAYAFSSLPTKAVYRCSSDPLIESIFSPDVDIPAMPRGLTLSEIAPALPHLLGTGL